MCTRYRYAAFISYSSKDVRFARRVFKALERYRIPRSLGVHRIVAGGIENRIYPVCLDREELPAGDLDDEIKAALKASVCLVVVCSPHSAESDWVRKEIEFFVGLGRADRVFALVAADVALQDVSGRDVTAAALPASLRRPTGGGSGPLAADARRSKDGFRRAILKVVAGMIRVSPGRLIDRDRARRRRQLLVTTVTVVVLGASLATVAAHVMTNAWKSALVMAGQRLMSDGRSLDGLALLLAGARHPTDVLPSQGQGAVEALQGRFGAGLVADLGPAGDEPVMSHDGSLVISRPPDPNTTNLRQRALARNWTVRRVKGGEVVTFGPAPHPPAISPAGDVIAARLFAGDGLLIYTSDRRQLKLPIVDATPEFSSDGRWLLFSTGSVATVLRVQTGRERKLPARLERSFFSRDAIHLIGRMGNKAWVVVDLDSPAYQPLPFVDQPIVNRDAKWAAGAMANGHWNLVEVNSGSRRDLGLLEMKDNQEPALLFSEGGKHVAWKSRDGNGHVLDLTSMRRTEVGVLGRTCFVPRLNRDGTHIAFLRPDQTGMVVDLNDGRQIDLGPMWLSAPKFDPTGTQVAGWTNDRLAFVHDLRSGRKTVFGDAGPLDIEPQFSRDGQWIAIGRGDSSWMVVDLASKARVELGRLAGGPRFAERGGLASVWIQNYDAAVVNVSTAAAAPSVDSRGLVSAICAAPGPGPVVRPVPLDHRTSAVAPGGEGSASTSATILKGRPWHPCDWRGLSSILPDAESGGRWFEGVRQQWRQQRVEWGLAQDYKCGEVNSAGETRDYRLEGCRVAGIPKNQTANRSADAAGAPLPDRAVAR